MLKLLDIILLMTTGAMIAWLYMGMIDFILGGYILAMLTAINIYRGVNGLTTDETDTIK